MTKILPISNPDNICGTSFHGDHIYASANEICNKLGVDVTCYDGDKVHYEFDLELADGTPFTIYDWKESDWVTMDTRLYYHIGAKTAADSQRALKAIEGYGIKGRDSQTIDNDVARLMSLLGR
jgi:hypothetical protein